MNPKPLSSLNHFTIPVAIVFPPALIVLRTRRLLSKGYERWHCDVGRITQPDQPTVATSTMGARLTPRRGAPCSRHQCLAGPLAEGAHKGCTHVLLLTRDPPCHVRSRIPSPQV